MRDPMFEHNQAWLAESRQEADAAREAARALADAPDIVSALALWCRRALLSMDVLDVRSGINGLSDLLALPPEHSPMRSFDRLPDPTRRQSLEESFKGLLERGEDDQKNGLAWLLGQALAKALVDELQTGNPVPRHRLRILWTLSGSGGSVDCAYQESLRELLRRCPLAFEAILSDLKACIDAIKRDPGIGTTTRERPAFNAAVDEWRSKPSIEDLWMDGGQWFPVHYRCLDMIPAILSVDEAAVLDHVDSFDFPHPIRQVLQYCTILHDRCQIAAALEAAPICSDDNQSWNHRLPAFLLLESVEQHCRELWRAACRANDNRRVASETNDETKDTLSTWLEQIGQIIMARQDGRFLGAWWLLLKTSDERMHRGRGRAAEGDRQDHLHEDELIEWIALGLARAGLAEDAISAIVVLPERPDLAKITAVKPAAPDDGETSPRLGALSIIALLDHRIGNGSSENVRALLDRLDALLVSRDSAFETEAALIRDPDSMPAKNCGYLLANTDEPASRWLKSWELLTEHRRRAQHCRETRDGDALAPTLFLLATGTSAIRWLMSQPDESPDDAAALWGKVFEGVRDCWLTNSPWNPTERIEMHIKCLFALHPIVFRSLATPDGLPESDDSATASRYSEFLFRDIDSLGGDDAMVAECCLNAYRNGASPATMYEVMNRKSGQVGALLEQFKRWQQFARSVRMRSDIVDRLEEMRTAILALEKPDTDTTPTSASDALTSTGGPR